MTEKRFKKDRGTFWDKDKRLNMVETVDLLNALHEENIELRKDVIYWRHKALGEERVNCRCQVEDL